MAFIPIPNAVEAQIRFECTTGFFSNTLYWQRGTTVTPETALTLAQYLTAWALDEILPYLSINAQLLGTRVYDQSSETGFVINDPVAEPSFGGNPGAPLPANVAWAIKFQTDSRGRSGRGRNYIGGLAEGSVENNQISADLANTLVNAYDVLRTAPPSTWTWVVASKYSGGAPRTTGVTTPITSVSYSDLRTDSQRRRL